MARYLLKRIFYMILTLFIVATVTFFLMKLMPGSPYANEAKMTLTQRHIMDEQYGLNKPEWQQYCWGYVDRLHVHRANGDRVSRKRLHSER